MKLLNVKNSKSGYYCVGFDNYSEQYIMETDDTCGNKRYYFISEQQYKWADTNPNLLEDIYINNVKMNNKSSSFFFSNWEIENTYEQNKIMWLYNYRDMLIGLNCNDVHKKMGYPKETLNNGCSEIYYNSQSEIKVRYEELICADVIIAFYD